MPIVLSYGLTVQAASIPTEETPANQELFCSHTINKMFDQYFAKQMRIMELNMLDQINHKDDEAASVTMTHYQDVPKPEKV